MTSRFNDIPSHDSLHTLIIIIIIIILLLLLLLPASDAQSQSKYYL